MKSIVLKYSTEKSSGWDKNSLITCTESSVISIVVITSLLSSFTLASHFHEQGIVFAKINKSWSSYIEYRLGSKHSIKLLKRGGIVCGTLYRKVLSTFNNAGRYSTGH